MKLRDRIARLLPHRRPRIDLAAFEAQLERNLAERRARRAARQEAARKGWKTRRAHHG